MSETSVVPTTALRTRFWQQFERRLQESDGPPIRLTGATTEGHLDCHFGHSGARIQVLCLVRNEETGGNHGELRVDLVLASDDADKLMRSFRGGAAAISEDVAGELDFHSDADVVRRVSVKRAINLMDEQNWGDYQTWLEEKLRRFLDVFSERIEKLRN